ncbi:MAG: hypothetical protein JXR78_10760 [Victivallales bacterium]|nr:hypothetical protein [Victivallales bacterium]
MKRSAGRFASVVLCLALTCAGMLTALAETAGKGMFMSDGQVQAMGPITEVLTHINQE